MIPLYLFAIQLFTHTQDDDDEGEGEEEHTRWWVRPRVWLRIAAFTLSAILLVVGIMTHNVEAMKKVNNSGVQLFRWVGYGVCKYAHCLPTGSCP